MRPEVLPAHKTLARPQDLHKHLLTNPHPTRLGHPHPQPHPKPPLRSPLQQVRQYVQVHDRQRAHPFGIGTAGVKGEGE